MNQTNFQDKSVIIDGADVSKCSHFEETESGFDCGELVDGACNREPMLNEYGDLLGYRACKGCVCLFKYRNQTKSIETERDRLEGTLNLIDEYITSRCDVCNYDKPVEDPEYHCRYCWVKDIRNIITGE